MSNIIGFLENAGSDAAMRYGARQKLLEVMKREDISLERSVLDSMLGVRETMYCAIMAEMPGKKKPAKKAPKKKAPSKKPPAKKPAKKAPAKKKPTKKK
jgi:hypothetical protein